MTKGARRPRAPAPDIQQRWNEYPRVPPGEYTAYVRYARRYQDPGYRRWTCLLIFDLLSGDLLRVIASVPMWLNLGSGDKPAATRRSRYTLEWARASGRPPARVDRLSLTVFRRRMARVEVGDTDPNKSPVPYSVVRRIIEWETGSVRVHSVNQSHSQGRHRSETTESGGHKE